MTNRANSSRRAHLLGVAERGVELLGSPADRPGDAADTHEGVFADPAVPTPVVELGKRELQERQGAGLRRHVGDELGDDGVVEVHARRGGGQDDGLVELGWRHRAEHEGSGADDRTDPRILQRPIEEVRTDRGDPPNGQLAALDDAGDDLDQRLSGIRREQSAPVLLWIKFSFTDASSAQRKI